MRERTRKNADILVRLMSKERTMYSDPELAKKMLHAHQLTDIEEMLIAWVHVVAKVCQLYKSAIGYQGNTLSVEKNAISVVNELPLLTEYFPVCCGKK